MKIDQWMAKPGLKSIFLDRIGNQRQTTAAHRPLYKHIENSNPYISMAIIN